MEIRKASLGRPGRTGDDKQDDRKCPLECLESDWKEHIRSLTVSLCSLYRVLLSYRS